ncbi:hypothetical protein Abiwalacus_12120 [Akkermansia biwaensis]|uniref:Uncharacterized protein n=1 Tax=Akkermansia biwaensis TaxID=2946555 RepID=A0ABN6QK84_9BACT|nr:hypothetical protein Abiwalacus_12120 [Akkermansia biwaensis]
MFTGRVFFREIEKTETGKQSRPIIAAFREASSLLGRLTGVKEEVWRGCSSAFSLADAVQGPVHALSGAVRITENGPQ